MNYKKIYDQLVTKCKSRGLDKKKLDFYTESHHILPRALGGGDEESNLVLLSAREHFIAHHLLWKMDKTNDAMASAFLLLSCMNSKNSHSYNNFRKEYSLIITKRQTGRYKDITGQRFGRLIAIEMVGWIQRTKTRTAKWRCLCDCGKEFETAVAPLNSGATRSCGCLKKDAGQLRRGEANCFYGKKYTAEMLEKRRASCKLHLMRPWEFERSLRDKENTHKWAMADLYYDLWIEFDKPWGRKLSKVFNELYCDSVGEKYFDQQIKKFIKGFNPHEDDKWKVFRDQYFSIKHND